MHKSATVNVQYIKYGVHVYVDGTSIHVRCICTVYRMYMYMGMCVLTHPTMTKGALRMPDGAVASEA